VLEDFILTNMTETNDALITLGRHFGYFRLQYWCKRGGGI